MKVLLDTCILAEMRLGNCCPILREFLNSIEDKDLFISVITIGEITKGIVRLIESRKKSDLINWVNELELLYSDRILPIDREVALLWGEITARAEKEGITVPGIDGLIAATALYHGLHVTTRNSKHFKGTGAFIINPGRDV